MSGFHGIYGSRWWFGKKKGRKLTAPVHVPCFFPERPNALFTGADSSDFICVMATPFKATRIPNPSNSRDLEIGLLQ